MSYAIIKIVIIIWVAILGFFTTSANAQTALPKAEKIIEAYIQKAGGKKRLKSNEQVFTEWRIEQNSETVGRGRMQWQNPGFYRFETALGKNSDAFETTATNGNVAWKSDDEGNLQTLTDSEAQAFRLLAILKSTKFVDLKNLRISAQTVGLDEVNGEKTYLVEFSARNGAKARVSFGANSKLPIKIENQTLNYSACLSDFRPSEKGVLEAHQIIEPCDNSEKQAVYQLEKITYNANLNRTIFDPPLKLENFNLVETIANLFQSEKNMLELIDQYSYEQIQTERTFDGKGLVKTETVRKYEVFPTKIGRRILKLVSENNVPLTGERLAKEEKRAGEKLVEAEEDYQRKLQKGDTKIKAERGDNNSPTDDGFERFAVLTILLISEIYAPRIEVFRNRPTLVFNFRPRPNFKPNGVLESVFSKMGGTIWVDKEEQQIIRLESRVTDNVKIGGGFFGRFNKDSAVVFERTKFGEVWLPKLFQSNLSAKFLLVRSFDSASDIQYTNYSRFNTEVKDSKIGEEPAKKPENE